MTNFDFFIYILGCFLVFVLLIAFVVYAARNALRSNAIEIG